MKYFIVIFMLSVMYAFSFDVENPTYEEYKSTNTSRNNKWETYVKKAFTNNKITPAEKEGLLLDAIKLGCVNPTVIKKYIFLLYNRGYGAVFEDLLSLTENFEIDQNLKKYTANVMIELIIYPDNLYISGIVRDGMTKLLRTLDMNPNLVQQISNLLETGKFDLVSKINTNYLFYSINDYEKLPEYMINYLYKIFSCQESLETTIRFFYNNTPSQEVIEIFNTNLQDNFKKITNDYVFSLIKEINQENIIFNLNSKNLIGTWLNNAIMTKDNSISNEYALYTYEHIEELEQIFNLKEFKSSNAFKEKKMNDKFNIKVDDFEENKTYFYKDGRFRNYGYDAYLDLFLYKDRNSTEIKISYYSREYSNLYSAKRILKRSVFLIDGKKIEIKLLNNEVVTKTEMNNNRLDTYSFRTSTGAIDILNTLLNSPNKEMTIRLYFDNDSYIDHKLAYHSDKQPNSQIYLEDILSSYNILKNN